MPDDFVRPNGLNEMDMGTDQTGRMYAAKTVNFYAVQMVRRDGCFLTAAKMNLSARKRLHNSKTGQQIFVASLHGNGRIKCQRIAIHGIDEDGIRHSVNGRNFTKRTGTETCPQAATYQSLDDFFARQFFRGIIAKRFKNDGLFRFRTDNDRQ